MKIVFVRHGHPDYANDTITELGKMQAEAASLRLAAYPFTRIFASTCGRAVKTAEYTAEKCGLPVEQLPFMREISWNPPDRTDEEKERDIFHPWHRADRLKNQGIDLLTYDYAHDPVYQRSLIPASEKTVREGIDAWLLSLGYEREGLGYRVLRENNETVALFSHAGASSCAFAHLLSLPLFYVFSHFSIDFTGITEIRLRGETGAFAVPQITLFNDHRHILTLNEKTENFYGN